MLAAALLVVLALVGTWLGLGAGLAGISDQLGGVPAGLEPALAQELLRCRLLLLGAVALPLLATLARRGAWGAPGVLPAVAGMLALGATARAGYSAPWELLPAGDARCVVAVAEGCLALKSGLRSWCTHALLGGVVAAAAVWAPALRPGWVKGARRALVGLPLVLLLALVVGGTSPEGSGARINLLGVQPIELAKLGVSLALGLVLGEQVEKLQRQRHRRWGLTLPRVELLLPALAVLGALFALLFGLGDLGPTLILGLVFLGLLAVGSGAWAELALCAAAALGLGGLLVALPRGWLPGRVGVRLDMWLEPWHNGLTAGDQTARGLWAIAAGGLRGQGPGQALPGVVWAGNNDLALANLAEVLGVAGVGLYLGLVAVLVLQGLAVGAVARSPGRALMAVGAALLVAAQVFVIAGGTLGLLPLTGVVVPFVSQGGTSLVVFWLLAGVLLRLAAEGRRVGEEARLRAMQAGAGRAAVGVLLGLGLLLGRFVDVGVWQGEALSARAILVTGADGTVFLKSNPRLSLMARRLPPGEVLDRRGEVLRGTDAQGQRTWPLGADLGTLLGRRLEGEGAEQAWPVPPEPWSVEAQHAGRIRGYPDLPQPLTVWLAVDGAGPGRVARVVEGRVEAPSPPAGQRVVELAQPDLREFARLLRLDRAAREQALAARIADQASRAVTLTLDGRLQRAAAEALREVVRTQGKAGSAVVIDVDSGEVLVRAQTPDLDLGRYQGDAAWTRRQAAGRDPSAWTKDEARFFGPYGPWRERSAGGRVQAGSIFKVATALAWARSGPATSGSACEATGSPVYTCALHEGRPGFRAPGWRQAIHDSHRQADGEVEVQEGLEVSCNAFFAQLGLGLGAQALLDLEAAGLTLDGGAFGANLQRQLDAAGDFALAQTAFGQGAARLSPLEAARLIAAVAAGGELRRCPLERGAACERLSLAQDDAALTVITAGLRKVVDSGTLRSIQELEGVRLYGKTGTADDPGRREEAPYGLRVGAAAPPHSWVVMFAESAARNPASCAPRGEGRLAVAVLVDRGGYGSGAARDVAMRIFEAAVGLGYLGPD